MIGVDRDPAMLASFTTSAAAAGVRSATVQGEWPDVAIDTPVADVVVCHHVVYNVADIEPQWNLVMTATVLAMLPPVVVVLAMQKLFVKGLVETEK